MPKSANDHDLFRRFLWSFSTSKCLHLHHGDLHTVCLMPADRLPPFNWMTLLVLQGHVESRVFMAVLHDILQQAPNLEVLSLYMAAKERPPIEKGTDAVVVVPDEASFSTTCLQLRLKEINMVHYEGNETQRLLARLLFRNATVLETLCVVFSRERFGVQTANWSEKGD